MLVIKCYIYTKEIVKYNLFQKEHSKTFPGAAQKHDPAMSECLQVMPQQKLLESFCKNLKRKSDSSERCTSIFTFLV